MFRILLFKNVDVHVCVRIYNVECHVRYYYVRVCSFVVENVSNRCPVRLLAVPEMDCKLLRRIGHLLDRHSTGVAYAKAVTLQRQSMEIF